ncbi:Uncharacterized protein XB17_00873 [Leptospira santarosai]|nr:Uncharacterized protein XB17_00873 [Leptospira santarosai]
MWNSHEIRIVAVCRNFIVKNSFKPTKRASRDVICGTPTFPDFECTIVADPNSHILFLRKEDVFRKFFAPNLRCVKNTFRTSIKSEVRVVGIEFLHKIGFTLGKKDESNPSTIYGSKSKRIRFLIKVFSERILRSVPLLFYYLRPRLCVHGVLSE